MVELLDETLLLLSLLLANSRNIPLLNWTLDQLDWKCMKFIRKIPITIFIVDLIHFKSAVCSLNFDKWVISHNGILFHNNNFPDIYVCCLGLRPKIVDINKTEDPVVFCSPILCMLNKTRSNWITKIFQMKRKTATENMVVSLLLRVSFKNSSSFVLFACRWNFSLFFEF